jgi:hypothetical protein
MSGASQMNTQLAEIDTTEKHNMPGFDGKLKKEQIEQLVGSVRELGKKH